MTGFWITEWVDYEGVACNSCGREHHNLFTWILCRIGWIDATLYHRYGVYHWLTMRWWDFQERFNKCSFCNRLNLFRKISYHSYHGSEEQLGDRYGKKWCQHCWNKRAGVGGCGYVEMNGDE
jgi:hypothetical protein